MRRGGLIKGSDARSIMGGGEEVTTEQLETVASALEQAGVLEASAPAGR